MLYKHHAASLRAALSHTALKQMKYSRPDEASTVRASRVSAESSALREAIAGLSQSQTCSWRFIVPTAWRSPPCAHVCLLADELGFPHCWWQTAVFIISRSSQHSAENQFSVSCSSSLMGLRHPKGMSDYWANHLFMFLFYSSIYCLKSTSAAGYKHHEHFSFCEELLNLPQSWGAQALTARGTRAVPTESVSMSARQLEQLWSLKGLGLDQWAASFWGVNESLSVNFDALVWVKLLLQSPAVQLNSPHQLSCSRPRPKLNVHAGWRDFKISWAAKKQTNNLHKASVPNNYP